jgi:hypothetical protein
MPLTTPDQRLLCIFGSRPTQALLPRPEKETVYKWEWRYAEILARRIPAWLQAMTTNPWDGEICGCASGADTAGEMWASSVNLQIYRHPAEWHKFGSGAGFIRNIRMAAISTHFLALWDGQSKGTAHMIRQIRDREKKGLRLKIVHLKPEDFLQC